MAARRRRNANARMQQAVRLDTRQRRRHRSQPAAARGETRSAAAAAAREAPPASAARGGYRHRRRGVSAWRHLAACGGGLAASACHRRQYCRGARNRPQAAGINEAVAASAAGHQSRAGGNSSRRRTIAIGGVKGKRGDVLAKPRMSGIGAAVKWRQYAAVTGGGGRLALDVRGGSIAASRPRWRPRMPLRVAWPAAAGRALIGGKALRRHAIKASIVGNQNGSDAQREGWRRRYRRLGMKAAARINRRLAASAASNCRRAACAVGGVVKRREQPALCDVQSSGQMKRYALRQIIEKLAIVPAWRRIRREA